MNIKSGIIKLIPWGSQFRNGLKKIISIAIIFIIAISIHAQEITMFKHFPDLLYGGGLGTFPPRYTDEIYENDGKFYWLFKNIDNRFNDVIEELDIHEFEYAHHPENPNMIKRSHIVLEYTPGAGFTDYVLLNHGDGLEHQLSFDGNRMLVVSNSSFLAVQDSIIVGDVDSLFSVTQPKYFSYAVYDMEADSFLATYFEPKINFSVLSSGLRKELIYTVSFNFFEYEFMGDSLDTFDPDDFYSSNTHLSKIKFVEAEKVWSYHIADTRFGNYGYLSDDILFDGDDNAVVINRIREPSQYKGEFLNNMGGIYDLEFYKVNSEGDLLNHQRINAPYDEAFRDFKVNADGSIDVFGRTRYPQTISVGEDTLFVTSDGNQGIAVHLDKDWNVGWMQSFKGSGSTTLYGMNSLNGESVLSVPLVDTVYLKDTTMVNPYYQDPPPTPYSEYGDIILKYNDEGNRIGYPVYYSNPSQFFELFQISEDHYLILLKGYDFQTGYEFLGENLGDIRELDYFLLEIEGDLFDVVSAVSELNQERDGFKVYPNPLLGGGELCLDVSANLMQEQVEVLIYDDSGRVEFREKIVIESVNCLSLAEVLPGLKHVVLRTNEGLISKPIMIR